MSSSSEKCKITSDILVKCKDESIKVIKPLAKKLIRSIELTKQQIENFEKVALLNEDGKEMFQAIKDSFKQVGDTAQQLTTVTSLIYEKGNFS